MIPPVGDGPAGSVAGKARRRAVEAGVLGVFREDRGLPRAEGDRDHERRRRHEEREEGELRATHAAIIGAPPGRIAA